MSKIVKRELVQNKNELLEMNSLKKIKHTVNQVLIEDRFEMNIDLNKVCYENRLRDTFYDIQCIDLCKKLLNKYLVRKVFDEENNEIKFAIGKIVEVEAYLGENDRASHTYQNKRTDRLKAMYMRAGHAYVYNIYGIYCCLNISSKEPGAGVLIRALEPVHGFDLMKINRKLTDDSLKLLTNGPSKLCIAMNISKSLFNQKDLANCENLWLQENLIDLKRDEQIITAKRVGINYAGEEAINRLLRFYIKENIFVSIKSKEEIEI